MNPEIDMKVSIIIPTYNRVYDLNECLDSIIIQTKSPREIVIVDDSDDDEIYHLIEQRTEEFEEHTISLKFIRNPRERSSAIARNVGIDNAVGDIVLFLDDDVILDREYIKNILKIYNNNCCVFGVQGHIINIMSNSFYNRINKILFLGGLEKNRCRVLASTNVTYPSYLDKTISCQWLSGSNQSYKISILKEFKFDEKLRRYSYKEDVDLSYRVYEKYPGSLYITPNAELIHKVSQKERLPNVTLIYMKQVYSLYFFYKNINNTSINKIIFLWSIFGRLLFSFGALMLKPTKSRWLKLKYLVKADLICIKYAKDIKDNNLEFFNDFL